MQNMVRSDGTVSTCLNPSRDLVHEYRNEKYYNLHHNRIHHFTVSRPIVFY